MIKNIIFILISLTKIQSLSPILIIPGDGGNSLEAKLNDRKNTPPFYCYKNEDWYKLWFDPK